MTNIAEIYQPYGTIYLCLLARRNPLLLIAHCVEKKILKLTEKTELSLSVTALVRENTKQEESMWSGTGREKITQHGGAEEKRMVQDTFRSIFQDIRSRTTTEKYTFLNTDLLWKNILEDTLNQTRGFIMLMVRGMIIELKTLFYLMETRSILKWHILNYQKQVLEGLLKNRRKLCVAFVGKNLS